MYNSVSGKTMENLSKRRDFKFATTEEKKIIWYRNQTVTQQIIFPKLY